jgi:hypothetical protein
MMRALTLAFVAGLATCAAFHQAQAQERLPAERWTEPYSATGVPPCEAPQVIDRIRSRFADTESSYWKSNLQIASVDNIRTIGFRSWGLDFIPRRFCTGTVTTSDGVRRELSYVVAEDTGIIGWGWGVRWCVVGLDRELAYAPACKMARP